MNVTRLDNIMQEKNNESQLICHMNVLLFVCNRSLAGNGNLHKLENDAFLGITGLREL